MLLLRNKNNYRGGLAEDGICIHSVRLLGLIGSTQKIFWGGLLLYFLVMTPKDRQLVICCGGYLQL